METSHSKLLEYMQSSRWRSAKIAIVGDIILDEYIEGSVGRISPEAPVPIHLVDKSFYRLGGAANAARNIAELGAHADLIGGCGMDAAADTLIELCQEASISSAGIFKDASRPTTKKTRIAASRQQMLRIDWEKTLPFSETIETRILTHLKNNSYDCVLLSDYGKGCLTPMLLKQLFAWAASTDTPVIVDPKGVDYTHYHGASLITPNRKEACEALGLDVNDKHLPEALAKALQDKYDLADILITLGAEGMIWLPKYVAKQNISCRHLPTRAREVFDVSGAGDTVAGVLTVSLASGMEIPEAMELANIAAGIVVAKWGTHPIEKAELEAALKNLPQKTPQSEPKKQPTDKVMLLPELTEYVNHRRSEGAKIVFTNGCFDLLHRGHVDYLDKAAALGDCLIVAINSDFSVKKLKGDTRPINSEDDRSFVLAALGFVSAVCIFSDSTPLKIINHLRPDILVKGADWNVDDIVGGKEVQSWGGCVETIKFVNGFSTTQIIEKIKNSTF